MSPLRAALPLCGLALLLPAFSLRAQTNATLSASGNWSTPGNWSGNVVPNNVSGKTYNATVGSGRTATLDIDVSIQDLAVGGSTTAYSTVTLNAGRTLTVNNSFNAGTYTVFNGGGTITLNAGAGASSGTSSNALLTFDGVTFNNQAGSVFADFGYGNFGTTVLHGGVINNAGTYSMDGANNGLMAGTGGGSFNNTGTFRGSGYTTVAFTSSGAIVARANAAQGSAGLLEFGAGGTSSGTLNTGTASSNGAQFDAGTWSFTGTSANSGAGRFLVAGAAVTINGAHNVTGVTQVNSGTLTFANANTTLAGPLTVMGGATNFTGANTLADFNLGATGSGGGTAVVNLGVNGTLSVTGAFNTGTYSQVNGTGTAAITARGGGSIGANSAAIYSGVTLNNAAGSTLTQSNAGGFDNTLQNGAVINNAGTWLLQNQNGRGFVAPGVAGAGAAFNNTGTLWANVSNANANIGFALNNTGVVRLDTGTGGGGNPMLAVGTFTQTAGSTQLAHDRGNFATLSSTNTIQFQGGSLVGSGKLVGNVAVTGANTLVSPGYSAGTITVQGTYAQTGGMLSLEIGRTTTGAGGAVNDLITGNSMFTLTGTAVTISLLSGSQYLQVGDSFTVISSTGNGLVMTGSTVTLDPSLSIYTFSQSMTASAYTLTITGVPEPGTWTEVGLGAAGLLAGAARRRRRRA